MTSHDGIKGTGTFHFQGMVLPVKLDYFMFLRIVHSPPFLFKVLPGLAWVIMVFDCPEVPLLCKEGWRGGRNVEWNHVGFTLQLVANSTTLPHLVTLFLFVTKPLTKGRRLAERKLGKNGEPTPMLNPEAPKKKMFPCSWINKRGNGRSVLTRVCYKNECKNA